MISAKIKEICVEDAWLGGAAIIVNSANMAFVIIAVVIKKFKIFLSRFWVKKCSQKPYLL